MKKRIWIIIGHPMQLPLAAGIAKNYAEKFEFHLLVSRHKYWSKVDLNSYPEVFTTTTFFPPVYYAHGLRALYRAYRNLLELKKRAKKLPISREDIIVSCEMWNYVENVITTIFASNKQIFLCFEKNYPVASMSISQIRNSPDLKIMLSGWVHYLFLEPLLGLKKRTLSYSVAGPEKDHGIAYSRPLEELYDHVFILQSIFTRPLLDNGIFLPYSLLREVKNDSIHKKRIVFFLSAYIRNENYYAKQNQILQTLSSNFGKNFLLELRLHPNDPQEDRRVKHEGWIINREPGNAQEYFMRHAGELAAAFSHVSTALDFGLNFNIPCYSYHRCMGLSERFEKLYDETYEPCPAEFYMRSFTDLPRPYSLKPAGNKEIRDSLTKLYYVL